MESKKMGKSSFSHAFALDSLQEERQRGITMDISIKPLTILNTTPIVLVDTPGHCDFISSIISGCFLSDLSILMVDSINGAFEAGISKNGQTKQCLIISKALGVKRLIVAINKMDEVKWSKDRYNEIINQLNLMLKTLGYKIKDVSYIPISSLHSINILSNGNDEALFDWYNGPCLFELINIISTDFKEFINTFQSNCHSSTITTNNSIVSRSTRLCIFDTNKSTSRNYELACKLYMGKLNVNDKLFLQPGGHLLKVISILVNEENLEDALFNDIVTIKASNCESIAPLLSYGSIISLNQCLPSVYDSIKARIIIFDQDITLTIGFHAIFNNGLNESVGILTKIFNLFDKSNVSAKKVRLLTYGNDALVQIDFNNNLVLDTNTNDKKLGRFVLIHRSKIIAAGIVMEGLMKDYTSRLKSSV